MAPWFLVNHLLGASLGLGSYLYYLRKPNEFKQNIRFGTLLGGRYIGEPQKNPKGGGLEYRIEDSLFAWYGDRLRWDSLVHSFSIGDFYSRRKGDLSGKVQVNLLDSSLEKVASKWRSAMYPGPLLSHLDACEIYGQEVHCAVVRMYFEELPESCWSLDTVSGLSIVHRANSLEKLLVLILRKKESSGPLSVSSINVLRKISMWWRVYDAPKVIVKNVRPEVLVNRMLKKS